MNLERMPAAVLDERFSFFSLRELLACGMAFYWNPRLLDSYVHRMNQVVTSICVVLSRTIEYSVFYGIVRRSRTLTHLVLDGENLVLTLSGRNICANLNNLGNLSVFVLRDVIDIVNLRP